MRSVLYFRKQSLCRQHAHDRLLLNSLFGAREERNDFKNRTHAERVSAYRLCAQFRVHLTPSEEGLRPPLPRVGTGLCLRVRLVEPEMKKMNCKCPRGCQVR